jgi:hypothetical protein
VEHGAGHLAVTPLVFGEIQKRFALPIARTWNLVVIQAIELPIVAKWSQYAIRMSIVRCASACVALVINVHHT